MQYIFLVLLIIFSLAGNGQQWEEDSSMVDMDRDGRKDTFSIIYEKDVYLATTNQVINPTNSSNYEFDDLYSFAEITITGLKKIKRFKIKCSLLSHRYYDSTYYVFNPITFTSLPHKQRGMILIVTRYGRPAWDEFYIRQDGKGNLFLFKVVSTEDMPGISYICERTNLNVPIQNIFVYEDYLKFEKKNCFKRSF